IRVSAPTASALTERLRVTKRSSAWSISLSVALAVSNIALASWRTSSGPRCLRIAAASLSSSSMRRMAAAAEPSTGWAGATPRAGSSSATGALLHQLAHHERSAGRILADEFADQLGARLVARRGFDHFERDFASRPAARERGRCVGRREERFFERGVALGACCGPLLCRLDQRPADK